MPLILCLDTALQKAEVALAEGNGVITSRANDAQLDHAAWIHTAIVSLLTDAGKQLKDLQAVVVTSGPGSYTGLRVGMATAKGLCYALGIPLITETTLMLLARSSRDELLKKGAGSQLPLFCPMIDARRMEVFMAVYDNTLQLVKDPGALVLADNSFDDLLQANPVVFSGNGSTKWQTVCAHPNATFSGADYNIHCLATVGLEKFRLHDFADLAYAEPSYLKTVYMPLSGS